MSNFRVARPIPRCVVTKGLLAKVEALVLQTAADLQGDEYNPDYYSVRVIDDSGTETLHRIAQYPTDQFNPSTSYVRMRYAAPWSKGELELAVTFSSGYPRPWAEEGARVTMQFKSDKSREAVTGAVEQILRLVEPHRHSAFFQSRSPDVYSVMFFLAVVAAGGLLVVYFAAAGMLHEQVREQLPYTAAAINVTVFLFCAISVTMPHCYFESAATTRRLDAEKYYSRTFLFGLLGVSVIKLLFSYLG